MSKKNLLSGLLIAACLMMLGNVVWQILRWDVERHQVIAQQRIANQKEWSAEREKMAKMVKNFQSALEERDKRSWNAGWRDAMKVAAKKSGHYAGQMSEGSFCEGQVASLSTQFQTLEKLSDQPAVGLSVVRDPYADQ